jgi:predicted HNH restriction endonuclease
MRKKRLGAGKKNKPGKSGRRQTVDEMVADLKKLGRTEGDYRKRSLEIHGLICAKCAREFDETNKHLLTVHHKDGNHQNNPPDGSNWENLCAYCHEDEHSRGQLGDYLSDSDG